MSCTLLFFGEERVLSAAQPNCQFQGMGSPVEVRERIDAGLRNGVTWSNNGWGQYGDDSCLLEFQVPDSEDPVLCVMIHVRGTGAVEALLRLAQQNGWYLVDDSLSPMSNSQGKQ